jgi:hypothetical protein
MLEADGVLHTWRLAQPPLPSASAIEATPLPDHRMMYLDYEGAISGNRGNVKRWDAGTFEEEIDSTPTARILKMNGTRLRSLVRLELMDPTTWHLVFLTPDT